MKIKISELFYSIQGEGTYTGYPFIFLRLAGCNLNCSYCDTKYSFNTMEEIEIDILTKRIKDLKVKNILVTGGEPLLQLDSLLYLFKKLDKYLISIETNGSISIREIPSNIHIVIDVKTPSSGFHNSFMLENLKYLKKGDDIKFVVSDIDDFNFSINFIEKYSLERITKNIIISPNINKVSPSLVAEWVLRKCNSNIKIGLQLHKFLGLK